MFSSDAQLTAVMFMNFVNENVKHKKFKKTNYRKSIAVKLLNC